MNLKFQVLPNVSFQTLNGLFMLWHHTSAETVQKNVIKSAFNYSKRHSLRNPEIVRRNERNVIPVWIIDTIENWIKKGKINRSSLQSISMAVSLFLFLLIMHKNQNVLCRLERFRFKRFISSFCIPDQDPFSERNWKNWNTVNVTIETFIIIFPCCQSRHFPISAKSYSYLIRHWLFQLVYDYFYVVIISNVFLLSIQLNIKWIWSNWERRISFHRAPKMICK